ncbi:glutamine synthetase/guanido kinase [Athelia psychrophila]|uniref:Glutamine synthetase n=1 Tax=Athelia psychrophila TaxID=1759441 RepID=A0A166JLV6_9AGAM|nr:glutamine synthetase/guanido kinase [Fibularhizoctonia sp. CBS 109695]
MSFDYGHKYTLQNVAQQTPLYGTTVVGLKAAGVEFVRIQWVDMTNTIRYRVVPIAYFEKLLDSPRPGVAIVRCALGMVYMTLADGFSPIGEYIYVIDMKTIRLCPYAPGHASVMGFFQEKAPSQGPDNQPTVSTNLCPRTNLQRIIDDARDRAGVEFLVGFESEFILLKSNNTLEAVNTHGYGINHALTSGSIEAQVMEEIAHALKDAGIELQMYHSEAASGQYEFVTGPLPPLESADALIHTRETITNIAAKHGLRATLAPRLYMDGPGSSCHTHLSIHPRDSPPPGPATAIAESQSAPPPQESSFLAGLLAHLPAITAFTLPQTSSYGRMVDGVWAGGTYVSWGTENREAPVRLCNAASRSARNFELRFVDGLANPYLALASILGAGTLGVKAQQPLTHADCSTLSAAEMDDAARKAAGITTRMSLNLDESRKALAGDAALQEVLGEELVEKYLSLNKALSEAMDAGTEEEAVARLIESY